MKTEIHVGNSSIKIDGELEEVKAILSDYWKPIAEKANANVKHVVEAPEGKPTEKPNKPRKRRKSLPKKAVSSSDDSGSQLDATDLSNQIKVRSDFSAIKKKILDVKGQWKEKCILVAVVADAPISSGDVKRVMDELRIKSSLPTLSRTLKNNSSEFLTQGGPNNSTLYTVIDTAKSEFLEWLEKANDE
ncbi:MAG: hypothetical protein QNJ16_08835 [Rhodobacter sp.]|nr:hypothetical protein [Rhodobacter sp.]